MLRDLGNAIAFLTIIPLRWADNRPIAGLFAFVPLVGLLIGILLIGLSRLPLNPSVMAFVVLVAWVVLTGALHLDGFADACDGLLATVPPARRLEIMKDSRTGAWAVIGLILLLVGKWIFLADLLHRGDPIAWWLLAAPILGRWAIVLAVAFFPDAPRPDGSRGIGATFRADLQPLHVVVASLFTLTLIAGLALLINPWLGLLLLVPLVTVALAGRWASQLLGGGLTGDTYGALCELTEWFTLLFVTLL
ncbi:MAG: adenosylcobinamide-GDP ribazoletransferase [Chloroflexi bacterium]|nr:adenosylcobinamide-GDP ribazoletransferase [Chloroflexota bacterium]